MARNEYVVKVTAEAVCDIGGNCFGVWIIVAGERVQFIPILQSLKNTQN